MKLQWQHTSSAPLMSSVTLGEHQQCGHKPAQGIALGNRVKRNVPSPNGAAQSPRRMTTHGFPCARDAGLSRPFVFTPRAATSRHLNRVVRPAIRCCGMILPDAPVTFTPDQIAQLNRQLSQMRHDINNALALVMAAVEMMRLKPELAERMTATLLSQPQRITDLVQQFSVEWETLAGIRRE